MGIIALRGQTMSQKKPFHLHGTSEDPPVTVTPSDDYSEVRRTVIYALLLLGAFVIYEEWMRYSVTRENAMLRQMVSDRDQTIAQWPNTEAIVNATLERLKSEGRLVEPSPPAVEAAQPKPPPAQPKPKEKPKLNGQGEVYTGNDLPLLPSLSRRF